jgi:hypothetical protein
MKNALITLVLISVLPLFSCTSIIMRFAGVRQPKIETRASVIHFLSENGIDTNDVYCLDSALFEKLRNESFKPGMSKAFRPVQIRVYRHDGAPCMQWASCEGYLKDLKIFDTIPPRVINGLNQDKSLKEDLYQYFTLTGSPANLSPIEGYDYYILIYFARYFPRMSKESFKVVNAFVLKHPEVKCKVYKINVDVLDFWGVELDSSTEIQVGGDK